MRRLAGLLLLFIVMFFHLLAVQAAPTANGIIRVSNNTSGMVSNGTAYRPHISRDGQYIVYESEATDLISGDSNGQGDIFLYSVASGSLSRISEPSGGGESNNWSRDPSTSETGLYTVFTSNASNLVVNDTNGFSDIFVYNRANNQLKRVSVASNGTQADLFSNNPAISANGRFIVFMSAAQNLTTLPHPLVNYQVFLHDRNPDKDAVWDEPGQILTVPVSINDSGDLANNFAGFTGRLAVSDDGMTIAFTSEATNLVPNDTNGVADVFIHRRDPDHNGVPDEPGKTETIRISVSSSGAQGNDYSFDPQMDSDGDLIVFTSLASNLVSGDTNGREDVLVYNRITGTTQRVSVSSSGAQSPGGGGAPDISADGRYVTFHGNDSTLTSPTCLSMLDCVYRHDRQTGSTELITFQPDGSPSGGHTYQPSMGEGGNKIVFLSENGYLVGNSSNNKTNVYLWIGSAPPANLTERVYLPLVVRN